MPHLNLSGCCLKVPHSLSLIPLHIPRCHTLIFQPSYESSSLIFQARLSLLTPSGLLRLAPRIDFRLLLLQELQSSGFYAYTFGISCLETRCLNGGYDVFALRNNSGIDHS
ncbi:hypothetical protein PR001_g30105 [Phytophthora rubi]|uniref:Uncharacterized protein n=1 Tax=Phytophthora rubi TaxID=129364 RepID=A0A6A3GVW1_9STRA|nr:hypothetical protein PR001_g30105 [Phytophthora rubi]